MEQNDTLILDLLQSKSNKVKATGYKLLFDKIDNNYDDYFYYLSHCSNFELKDFIRHSEYHLPFLRKGFEKPIHHSKKKYRTFNVYHTKLNKFILALRKHAGSLDPINQKKLLERLLFFPGISSEIETLFIELIGGKRKSHDPFGVGFSRQLQIFLTYNCNLNCPYCFNGVRRHIELSLSQLKKILEWAVINNVKTISLSGGEPTIHPHFEELLSMLENHGLTTYFASNLTKDIRHINENSISIIQKVHFHLTNETILSNVMYDTVCKNVRFLQSKSVEVDLRCNIDHLDFDYSQYFEIAKSLSIYRLVIALTFPSADETNTYIKSDTFQSYSDLLMEIIQNAQRQKIKITFAKPIPPCIFPDNYQDRFLNNDELFPICSCFQDNYSFNMCITPDLKMAPCMGLTKYQKKFLFEYTWNDITKYCETHIKPLLNKQLFIHCDSCFLFDRKLCQGSCLSHKIESNYGL